MKIDSFEKEYDFLSNFYEGAPMVFEGITYYHSEGAYQAAKTLDQAARQKIADIISPKEAKRAGRSRTLKVRSDWDDVKIGIMHEIVRQKFLQHEDLRDKLLGTGDAELVEGNWWGDAWWGVCNGTGRNELGKILMKVRDEFANPRCPGCKTMIVLNYGDTCGPCGAEHGSANSLD